MDYYTVRKRKLLIMEVFRNIHEHPEKTFTPESEISFGVKQKKNVFVESLDHFRSLEIREKVRNVFVMSLRLSDHEVLHNIASSSTFFDFAKIFSLFSIVFRTSKLLEFKEFNKTIIPFALVGYETGYHLISNARSWNNC